MPFNMPDGSIVKVQTSRVLRLRSEIALGLILMSMEALDAAA